MMPIAPTLHKTSNDVLARRLASKAARFRLALGLGFVVAAVGFATVVVNDRDGVAGTIFGLPDIFGIAARQEAVQGEPAAAKSAWRGWLGSRHHAATRARVVPARYMRSIERASRGPGAAPMQLGRQSMCVRLCDGFAFPVGLYHGEQDRASHEATCRSECPGAATALYVEPAGAESMDAAIRVGTRKTYSELPYAFHYTTVLADACSCHPREGNAIKSLLHDFTLRRGDAVMTSTGFKVFHGAARFPYRRSDFATLAQSRDLRQADRAAFHAIERASLRTTPNVVAEIVPGAPASKPVARNATKGLEHQASLTPVVAPPAPPPAPSSAEPPSSAPASRDHLLPPAREGAARP